MRHLACFCLAAAVAACSSAETVSDPTPKDAATSPVDASREDVTSVPFDAAIVDAPAEGHADDHFVWPDCSSRPPSVPSKKIADVWTDNPSTLAQVWLSGVYVTAISKGGCSSGAGCDVYLQQDLTYANLAAGAHKAIKLFVSANTAMYFTGIAVGDRVDAMGWALRSTVGGANELYLQVNQLYPGCALTTGSGVPTPIQGVTLADLTLPAIEDTYGPLLVQVSDVRGTPGAPGATFGLGSAFFDGGGGGAQVVSLSPFFLPAGVFTGLTQGQKTTFKSVTGVFGLFTPPTDASVTKYLEIYPRTTADLVQ